MLYSVNLLVKMLVFYAFPGKNAVFDESPRENSGFLCILIKILYSMNLLVKMLVFYVSPGKNTVFDESPRENTGFLCISGKRCCIR